MGWGETATCPWCGIDSVIGDKSGFEITDEFLAVMEEWWFGLKKDMDREKRERKEAEAAYDRDFPPLPGPR
jgi:hypothetical protein